MRSVLCLGLVLTGCFYLDPINRGPEIRKTFCSFLNADPSERTCEISGFVRRGDAIELGVEFKDDDSNSANARFEWKAALCFDDDAVECGEELRVEDLATTTLEVPSDLVGIRAINIDVEVRDERGALARLSPMFRVNDPPTLRMGAEAHSYVVGGPIDVSAEYDDLDDGPDDVTLRWEAFGPDGDPAVLEERAVDARVMHNTRGKRLVPDSQGDWLVKVTASDPEGEVTVKLLTLPVAPDGPPCLAGSQPAVPPDGATLPISEPTLFQVPLVHDDLDPYPRLSAPGLDMYFGTTRFAWSILAPGGSGRQVLVGATGNSVDLDPSVFTPGEIVELRVEIFDRKDTPIACADDAARCSVTAQAECIQRQTWRVEAR